MKTRLPAVEDSRRKRPSVRMLRVMDTAMNFGTSDVSFEALMEETGIWRPVLETVLAALLLRRWMTGGVIVSGDRRYLSYRVTDAGRLSARKAMLDPHFRGLTFKDASRSASVA